VESLADLKTTYWDLYKEVHGIRDRGGWVMDSPDAAFVQAAIDLLHREGVEVFAEEKRQQAEAVVRFEKHIAMLINMGAGNRESALRWMHDADNTDGDLRYLEFVWGLPYNHLASQAA
jgi:hypothetical protein